MSDSEKPTASPPAESLPGDTLSVIEQAFDEEFYKTQVGQDAGALTEPVYHYVTIGVQQGLDPSPGFSTAFYLSRYEDVAASGMNPYYHYLKFGRDTGRWPMSPLADSYSNERLYTLLSGYFDAKYYLQAYPDIEASGLDPLEHYIRNGYREERLPFPGFDLEAYVECFQLTAEDNPLYHYAVFGRFSWPPGEAAALPWLKPGWLENEKRLAMIVAIRPEFLIDYYLDRYPDVRENGIDPVRHYVMHGWKEGRNPRPDFDTRFYLETNPDVKASGVNPFWHYLVRGMRENRRSMPSGDYKRAALYRLESLQERVQRAGNIADVATISSDALYEALSAGLISGAESLVVSVGHDDYLQVVGGVQSCIAIEQSWLNDASVNYLNLSPAVPRSVLADNGPSGPPLALLLNGRALGATGVDTLLDVLDRIPGLDEWRNYLVVHALHGHSVPALVAIAARLRPQRSFFWLHDFFSLCPGYQLLRNDISYCHAPDVASQACGICVYGEARAGHLAELAQLFDAIAFDVVSPSRFALDLWLEKSALPQRSTQVVPHLQLVSMPPASGRRLAVPERPLRIAFLGYPVLHKGWPLFEELVNAFANDARYAFYQIGIGRQYNEAVTFIEASASHDAPDIMADRAREAGIDVVVMASIWPETFSLTAYEAISAGCYLLALPDSGNIVALLEERGCGRVCADEKALHDLFSGGDIVTEVRSYREREGNYGLQRSAVTASLILERDVSA